jgi:6-phosphogluconolactonase
MSSTLLYVGTYTGTLPHVIGRNQGIHTYQFDHGKLTHLRATPAINPSFLAADRAATTLYAVNESLSYQGIAQGAVSAYRIAADGSLNLLNQEGSGGTGPCHISIDPDEKWLMVANYYGGSVAVFPRLDDGSVGKMGQLIQHEGAALVHPTRQDQPHAHLTLSDPTSRYVYVPDLGLDQVLVYRLAGARSSAALAATSSPLTTDPGAGPRHLAFHPDGKHVMVINELNSTIVAAEINRSDGSLTTVTSASTLPPGHRGKSTCSEVAVSASGIVYGANRGHDSIVTLAFDGSSLQPLAWTPSGGRTPRHFAIDPSGQYIVVANQDSDNLVVFEIHPDSAVPKATGEQIECATPVYNLFVETTGLPSTMI